jgi:hypothetical protein
MTEHVHEGHPPAEADRIRTWTIVAVGVGSLALFLAASLVTVAYMERTRAQMNPSWPMYPGEAGRQKIGIVEQQLFENANRAQALKEQQERRLHSYGWVDRSKGVAHIPIERAMDLSLQGARP